jgi:hypothetical protein
MSDTFQYFNVMDVDPTFKPIEPGAYTLQLAKIGAQVKTPQSGKMAGQETLMINATFIVVDDPTYSGRRLFNTFWIHNPFDQKILRKIADRTGVTQAPGESLTDWLAKLTQIQPRIKAPVTVQTENAYPPSQNPDGTPVTQEVNKVDFRSIAAA